MQRAGALTEDGQQKMQPRTQRPNPGGGKRTGIAQFFRQVMAEMHKVLWPPRSEIINYTVVTIVSLALIGVLIYLFDVVFLRGVQYLYR